MVGSALVWIIVALPFGDALQAGVASDTIWINTVRWADALRAQPPDRFGVDAFSELSKSDDRATSRFNTTSDEDVLAETAREQFQSEYHGLQANYRFPGGMFEVKSGSRSQKFNSGLFNDAASKTRRLRAEFDMMIEVWPPPLPAETNMIADREVVSAEFDRAGRLLELSRALFIQSEYPAITAEWERMMEVCVRAEQSVARLVEIGELPAVSDTAARLSLKRMQNQSRAFIEELERIPAEVAALDPEPARLPDKLPVLASVESLTVRSATVERKSSEYALDLAERQMEPRVSFNASGRHDDYTSGSQLNRQRYIAFLKMELPLFASSQQLDVAQAQAELAQSRLAEEQLRADRDARWAQAVWSRRMEDLALIDAEMDAAQQALAAAHAAFEEGLGDPLDILAASLKIIDLRRRRVDVRRDAVEFYIETLFRFGHSAAGIGGRL